MARGISIKDVENKVQHISDNNVIPLSTGADVPEVVTVGVLKEHINEDVDTALEGKQDVINDLAAIRSGAALGATALQSYTESDPTVPFWAKQPSKPSYSYSEITGKPTLSAVATSGSYNDLTNKPTIPVVPTNVSAFTNDAGYLTEHQDISGKANSDDLATVAFSGDYEDLTNTPTIPDVPEWAMSSTKPSYTVSEIDGAQEELVSGTNIKTINNESILGSGNITIQGGGGGDVNVIESITFNGSAVPVDSSKNAAIAYSAPVTSVNGDTGAVTISVPTKVSDLTNDSGFITSYTETDPVFSASTAASITSSDITKWDGKQDALVAGASINILTNIISKNLWNPTNSTNSSPGFNASSRTVGADGTITITNNSGNAVSRIQEEHTAAELGLENGKVYTLTIYCDSLSTNTNKKSNLWYNGGYTSLNPASGTNYISVTWTQANNAKVQVGLIYFDNVVNGETKSYKIQLEQSNIITEYVAWNVGKQVPVISAVVPDVTNFVPTTRTVNGKALSADITLSASDVSALPSSTVIPAAQVNSDWNASSGVAQILNKPTIPDVSGKENTSNKVTSLSSSSTDTQYPSAKCVWDLVGDIETILSSI